MGTQERAMSAGSSCIGMVFPAGGKRRKVAKAFIATIALCGFALFAGSTTHGQSSPTLLDFDSIDASHGRVVAIGYLAKFGITLSGVTEGTLVVIDNQNNFYEGRSLVASSPQNMLTQINSNDPVSFTLDLPAPAGAIRFTRPKLLAGPTGTTFPAWRARALNGKGEVLDEVSEPLGSGPKYYSDVPARSFTLKGPGIKAVRFDSNNMHFAGYSAVVIDDLTIVYK